MRDRLAEFAGLEIAGLEFDGHSRRGGKCRTGKWRTGIRAFEVIMLLTVTFYI